MKILIDGRMYGTEYTGIGRYVLNLVENLQKIDTNNKYGILLKKKYYHSLKLEKNWEKILADIDHYSLAEQTRLPQIIKRLDYDITHFPHFNVPIMYRGKFVVTLHDLIMHKRIGKHNTTKILPIYYAKLAGYKGAYKHSVKKSKRIICPSEYTKSELVENFKVEPRKIKVVYEGFDSRIKPGKNKSNFPHIKDSKYFLYVGNAYPHKNINRLVEAVKFLNLDLDKKVKLVLVISNNHFREKTEKFANQLGIKNNIVFLDSVTDSQLSTLYSGAESFVYPSLEEGFGLQGLESMAHGTLVAASDIPVFREVYKDNCLYFNPLDFSSIQKTLLDILNMKSAKKRGIVSKAKRLPKKYSFERMAKDTLRVYKEAAKL